MINRVKKFCRQNGLLFRGDKVVIGLSGGADSVCLFFVLLRLAAEWNLTLLPVHIHHGIRGEEADSDAEFCEELCRRHGLTCTVYHVSVPELAKQHGWSLEEAGRNARYQIFSTWKESGKCDKIAVAHHKNDQAETVLFQMFRGSRLKGLSGMQPCQGAVIRPLLCVQREEIEKFLEENGQTFCIDRTNFEEEYTRNVIRRQILPKAQQIQPRALEHIVDTAEYLGRVEDFLEELSTKLYKEAVIYPQISEKTECYTQSVRCDGMWKVALPLLCQAPPLLAERVIYRVLGEAAGGKKDISAGYVQDCMELCKKQTGRSLQLPGGLVVRKVYEELWIGKAAQAAEDVSFEISEFPFEKVLPDGRVLHLFLRKNEQKDFFIPKSTCTKWFNYDKIKEIVVLRTLQKQDYMVLYTDGRGKRAAEVLKDAKIPKEERERLWLLAVGNEVLWFPGIRGSEAYHVTQDTETILIATIEEGE